MNDNKKIVLIISNELNHEGGISSFYETLFKNFSSENFKLKHLKIGSRQYFFNAIVLKRLIYIVYYLFDFLKYIFKLSFNKKNKNSSIQSLTHTFTAFKRWYFYNFQ